LLLPTTNQRGFAINTHKHTSQSPQRQAFPVVQFQNDKNYRGSCNPITSAKAYQDIQSYVRGLTPFEQDVLNYALMEKNKLFLTKGKKYRILYMEQQTIASFIGSCRKTVNRAVAKLLADGMIGKVTRRGAKSCHYTVNELFLDLSIRNKLSDLLPALRPNKYVALSLARSQLSYRNDGKSLPYGFFITNVPQLVIIDKKVLKESSNSLRESLSTRNVRACEVESNTDTYADEQLLDRVSSPAFLNKKMGEREEMGDGEPITGTCDVDEATLEALIQQMLARSERKVEQKQQRVVEGYDSRFGPSGTLYEQRLHTRSPFQPAPKSKSMAEMLAHNKRMREQCN
jgi:hypothetical protein